MQRIIAVVIIDMGLCFCLAALLLRNPSVITGLLLSGLILSMAAGVAMLFKDSLH